MPRLTSFHLRLSSDHQISNGSLVSAHCVLIFWPQWPLILNPDDKIKTTSFKVRTQAMLYNMCSSSGINSDADFQDDTQGRAILQELQADSIDTSFVLWKTRTCIHTPGYPPLIPSDLSLSRLTSALDEARILYLDGRVHETAFLVAQKVAVVFQYPAWTGAVSVPSALVSMLLRLPKIKFPIVTLGEDGCIMLG
ncbi:hypothetical protein D8674_003037 [Pyrus ussuriensis x Pyrus communis]|uniref:Uncharacterized protein n=1 Tax=Pyrus ussuriensis x Pyrus communis TaxID=2448454 RepID=A0A5N5FLE7_9ROSA|nr:hypothetical protein D8674_003037 [Pyrus ussuriensis x Pyrus communis]